MKRWIKAVIALLLIVLLLRGVDWHETQAMLSRVTPTALAVVLVAMIGELALSAWKWSWALRMHELRYGFGYLFNVLAKGYFINNFLPTAVGGDAYRVYRTMPADGFKSRAVSAVLLERITGLLALLFWGALAACFLWRESPIARWYLGLCVAGAVGALAVAFILYKGGLKALTNRVRHLSVFTAIEHNVGYLRRARVEWPYVAVLSLAFQATSIGIVYWLFTCIGHPIDASACALMAAAAGVAAVLPISINGIGVMEGSLVGMAVALGVEYESAVLVAVLRRLMMVALSVLCGAIFLIDRETVTKPGVSAARAE